MAGRRNGRRVCRSKGMRVGLMKGYHGRRMWGEAIKRAEKRRSERSNIKGRTSKGRDVT